jgi:hypothetical protein
MPNLDYEANLRIDEDALDLECLDQPMRFMEVAKASATADFEYDESKNKLEITMAEVDDTIRKNIDKYETCPCDAKGNKKPTEVWIANQIKMDADYQISVDNVNEAKKNMAVLKGAVKSFDQRKNMLETLTRLCLAGYFAGPTFPRDIQNERSNKAQKAQKQAKVQNKMVKRGMKRKGDE